MATWLLNADALGLAYCAEGIRDGAGQRNHLFPWPKVRSEVTRAPPQHFSPRRPERLSFVLLTAPSLDAGKTPLGVPLVPPGVPVFFRPPGVPFCTLLIIKILLMFRSFFALVVVRRSRDILFSFSFDFFYPKEREIMLLHGVGLPRCSALLRWLKS